MIPIEEALQIVEDHSPRLMNGSVELQYASGRVLAADIYSDMFLPPFDRSQMDGFAVRKKDVEDSPVVLEIVGESVAGKGWDGVVKKNQAVRIMTGARVPEGADAVQMVEETASEGNRVKILKSVKKMQNIVKLGSEMSPDQVVLESGTRLTDQMIATIASFGIARVPVGIRPRVSILATGSEIVPIEKTPGRDQIRNSNSWSLSAFARSVNADAKILAIAPDDLDQLTNVIDKEINLCDLLIISGGVSVGDYDFTKPALKRAGVKIHFEKVALKPGKPTVFGTKENKVVFGLPGNPVSVAVTFLVFVRTVLMLMQGAEAGRLVGSAAVMGHDLKGVRGRDSLLPVTIGKDLEGRETVETIRFSGSSNFINFASSNGLVFVGEEKKLKKGDLVQVFRTDKI